EPGPAAQGPGEAAGVHGGSRPAQVAPRRARPPRGPAAGAREFRAAARDRVAQQQVRAGRRRRAQRRPRGSAAAAAAAGPIRSAAMRASIPQVLVVDDEPAIRESLAFALKRDGFAIAEAASLREAEQRVAGTDLVILDLVLPDGSGLDFLRGLRSRSDVPVIVLTSRDEETDRVVGLEMGADDYVLKPFSPREVVARVRAVLRRVRGDRAQPEADTAEPPIEGPGRLRVDPRSRRASVGDTELALSRTEFNLLAAFLRAPGRVFERGQL